MTTTRIASALRWVIVAALLILLVVPTLITLIGGSRFVVVDGGSMRPTYQYGDVLLISDPTRADFQPGHVITVRRTDGSLYTHRVKTLEHGKALLQGDGNTAPDPSLITYRQVVGAVRMHFGAPLSEGILIAQSWPGRISILLIIIAGIVLPLDGRRRAPGRRTTYIKGETDVETVLPNGGAPAPRDVFMETR